MFRDGYSICFSSEYALPNFGFATFFSRKGTDTYPLLSLPSSVSSVSSQRHRQLRRASLHRVLYPVLLFLLNLSSAFIFVGNVSFRLLTPRSTNRVGYGYPTFRILFSFIW